MEDLQKLSGNLIKLLRANPRGMSITEISRVMGLNRNSTAKYLDILLYTGRIEVRTMGRAKLYYISQRVPISALLDFSSDHIIGLDGQLKIIEVNDNFLKFFNIKKDMLIDRKITSTDLPIFNTPFQLGALQNAIKGSDSNLEFEIPIGNEHHYFRSKLIPTILADGKKGVTVILENVDQQRVAQKLVHESEVKFRAIYQSARDAMIITDNESLFECNNATKEMFGCNDVEFIQRKFHFFSPPTQPSGGESQALLAKNMELAMKNGLSRFDWVHRRFDGTDFQAETIITPIELYGQKALLFVIRDISERKDMEAAIRDKEELYRTLFESLPDAVLILEGQRVIQCNESSLRMFGFSSVDEMIGKHPTDLSPPFQPGGEISRTKANRLLKEVEETEMMRFEWEHLRKGDPFVAEVSLIKTKLNERPVIQATIRDITEFRMVQENLRSNEARLRSILSSLHGSFIGLIGQNYRYEGFWGSKELDMKYGLSASMMIGRSVFEFGPSDKMEELRLILERVMNTGEPFNMEVDGELPAGRFYQDMTFSPFRDQEGGVKGVVQFATDTTEKNLVFNKLRETERLYHLLDDNVSDVIWITDNELNYTYLSSSSRTLTGYEPEELIGRNVIERLTKRSLDHFMEGFGEDFREFLAGKKREYPSQKIELELIRKDGSAVWTEIGVTILTGPDMVPIGMLGITREISKEKEVWDELIRREAILLAISDMSSRFLSGQLNNATVQVSLEKIGKATDINRVYISKIGKEPDGHRTFQDVITWTDEGVGSWINEPTQFLQPSSSVLEDWIKDLEKGDPLIKISQDLPSSEKEFMSGIGSRSILLIPILEGGNIYGLMGLENTTTERRWSDDEVKILQAAAHILGYGYAKICK